ncbi:MAG: histidine phosphatase family protein [Candidatus Magasanikbacteria bacterium]|nr:histidine phosphatase family protein [Candidatus Magasanikbacteria bacterium]
MRFYFIRHGITSHNERGIVQSRSDIPLSDMGREQAALAGDRLKNEKISGFYASPLSRARETAEIIAAPHNLPVTIDSSLLEIDAGDLEDKSYLDLIEFRKNKTVPFIDFTYPNGERIIDVFARAQNFLDHVLANHNINDTIAVVSHGAFLRAMFSHLLKVSLEEAYVLLPTMKNTAVSIIDFNLNDTRIIELGSVTHLDTK